VGYCSIDILELTLSWKQEIEKWFIGSLPGVGAFEKVTRVIKIQVTFSYVLYAGKT